MHVFELCKLHVGQKVASCRWTATSCKVAPSDNTAQCTCCMYLLTLASIQPLHSCLNQDQDTLVYITHLHPHTTTTYLLAYSMDQGTVEWQAQLSSSWSVGNKTQTTLPSIPNIADCTLSYTCPHIHSHVGRRVSE